MAATLGFKGGINRTLLVPSTTRQEVETGLARDRSNLMVNKTNVIPLSGSMRSKDKGALTHIPKIGHLQCAPEPKPNVTTGRRRWNRDVHVKQALCAVRWSPTARCVQA